MGDNEGFEVKVIDVEAQVGDGESKEAKGKDVCARRSWGKSSVVEVDKRTV